MFLEVKSSSSFQFVRYRMVVEVMTTRYVQSNTSVVDLVPSPHLRHPTPVCTFGLYREDPLIASVSTTRTSLLPSCDRSGTKIYSFENICRKENVTIRDLSG